MSTHQAAMGLCLASLALHMAAPAKRYCPEAVAFCQRLLHACVPVPPKEQQQQAQQQQGISSGLIRPGLLQLAPAAKPGSTAAHAQQQQQQVVQPLGLYEVLGSDPSSPQFGTEAFKHSLLSAALGLLSRAAQLYSELEAFPEAFSSSAAAAQQLLAACGSGGAGLPAGLQQQLRALAASLAATSRRAVVLRRPRLQAKALAAPVAKEFNPR
jgi:hypothetical protein